MKSRREYLGVVGLGLAAGCLGSRRGDGSGAVETTSDTKQSETKTTESNGQPTSPTETSPSVTDVSLLLNWKPSGLHVPYYAAKAEGFYEEEGLTVRKIKSGEGSDFSAKQAGLGNVPFAVTSADQILNVNSRELSPRAVATVMQNSPVVLFASRENFGEEFTDPKQLAGKTVGSGPGMVRLLSELLLKEKGVFGDVSMVDTGFDTVQQLLSGKIDVAGGVFSDVIDARHQGETIDSVSVTSVIPSYGHVIATDESFLKDHPATVSAFLRATARGSAWATENPEAATDHLVEAIPALEESRSRQLDKWKMMTAEYVLSGRSKEGVWGRSRSKPWTTMYEAMRGADLLGGSLDPSTVWTNGALDTDYKYIGSYADVTAQS